MDERANDFKIVELFPQLTTDHKKFYITLKGFLYNKGGVFSWGTSHQLSNC